MPGQAYEYNVLGLVYVILNMFIPVNFGVEPHCYLVN